MFGLQSAVYSWAKGQSRARQATVEPGDHAARTLALTDFDLAITRLAALLAETTDPADPLADNLRFRLARALADRVALDPSRATANQERRQALASLGDRPFAEASVRGFVELLRAELLAGLDRFDEAQQAWDASATATPPPPISERLTILVPIAAARGRVTEAAEAIEKSGLDEAERSYLMIKLRLAERSHMEPGPDRARVEANAFRRVGVLRKENKAEARAALIDLARAIDEPAPGLDPEAWDLLSEGAQVLGQNDRAARLLLVAAAKVEAKGEATAAAGLRFRAASILFLAGRFARAEGLFGRVVDDPSSPVTLQARAGMLRAISLGRALENSEAGSTREAYEAALSRQLKKYPDDPASGEARWLLGRVRMDAGERNEAESLWASVPKTHARWIDAQLARRALARDDLEARRLLENRESLRQDLEKVHAETEFLRTQARDEAERAEVALELARLDLIPGVGNPTRALEALDRLLRSVLRDDQRERAAHLRIAALAMTEHYVEAETLARRLDAASRPRASLLLARVLDHAATATEVDRVSRRLGGIEQMVVDRVGDRLSPGEAAELRLRKARSRMLRGDTAGAGRCSREWPEAVAAVAPLGPDAMVDLGEVEAEAGEPTKAMEAFRRVTKGEASGSPRWFRARLGQAHALERAGQKQAARQILDGTALLYPDLGGPVMRAEV